MRGVARGQISFDSLSQTLGSMTEFVSFSVDATNADIVLGERREWLAKNQHGQREQHMAECVGWRWRIHGDQSDERERVVCGQSLRHDCEVRSRNGLRRRLVCSDCRIERLGRRPGGFQYSLYFGSAECERDAGGDVPGVVDHDEWSGSGAVE